jgi:hypothetical protein
LQVAELFNTGDPALNGTTPLLLALRLGEDGALRAPLVVCSLLLSHGGCAAE